MRVSVNNHDLRLPVYRKNRTASLLCIFKSTVVSIIVTIQQIVYDSDVRYIPELISHSITVRFTDILSLIPNIS